LVSGQARRGDEELTGGVQKISAVGCGVECECEFVAQKVRTTILFRHIYSGDVKSDSEKCWLHKPSMFLYCTAYPDFLPTADPCTYKKKHRILLQCHSLANVLHSIYHASRFVTQITGSEPS